MAPPLIVQWNCRGLRRKISAFRLYLQSLPHPPSIILLQETHGVYNIAGYDSFIQPSIPTRRDPNPRTYVVTYVLRTLPTHQVDVSAYNSIMSESVLTITQFPGCSIPLVVMNSYWLPKARPALGWLGKILRSYRDHAVIWAGDFNAHHPDWLYTYTSPSGQRLRRVTQQLRFSLLNDLTSPTRQGNSCQRDTIPDLTWAIGLPSAIREV